MISLIRLQATYQEFRQARLESPGPECHSFEGDRRRSKTKLGFKIQDIQASIFYEDLKNALNLG